MGVKGLWKLIEEAGTPVPLESLEHKILAVDVSIWLHQAVRGFRGIGGEAVANAHLLTLFHRICKVLFYRIRPVFVFDGGVPHLKKQTLSFRRTRREAAANRAQKVRERLLTNLLKSHAVRSALGRSGPIPTEHRVLPAPKPEHKDMFELPPLPDGITLGAESDVKIESSDDSESESQPKKKKKTFHYKNIHNFDQDSEEFLSLPLQKKHEILVELQDSRKDNSWATINQMPNELSEFSSYQMNRMLKRWKFQETVDGVRNAIQKEKSDELEQELFGDLEKHVSQTYKIASEAAAHSIVLRTVSEEAPAKKEANVDKGKSLMKNSSKDFLTELKKQGFLHPYSSRNHESDNDDPNGNSSDSELAESVNTDEKDDPLLHVMNYVMEDNNGLTQEEIFSLIQQSSDEVDKSTSKPAITDQPSTSRNASGIVANPDISSESDSDNDDFVEVPEHDSDDLSMLPACSAPESPALPGSNDVDFKNDNIAAIRASNSSSLYIKIVQHRLDDIIQKSDSSPKKVITDTRKLKNTTNSSEFRMSSAKRNLVENNEASNGLTLTIDINKAQKLDDDLFADVFSTPVLMNKDTKNVTEPSSKPNHDQARTSKNLVSKRKTENISVLELPPEASKIQSTSKKIKMSLPSVEITSELQDKVDELVKKQVDEMLKNATLPKNAKDDIARLIFGKSKENVLTPELPANDPDVMDSDIDDDLEAESCDEDSSTPISLKASTAKENFDKSTSVSSELHNSNEESSTTNNAIRKVTLSEDPVSELVLPGSIITVKDTETSATDELPAQDSSASDGRDKLELEAMPVAQDSELHSSQTSISSDRSSAVELSSQLESRSMQKNSDDLKRLEGELVNEQKILVAQAQKGDRVASNLSQQMYTDAQDLLQLFGLPYLVAPMEAEAQCAFLDEVGLTNGTITDDSDAFLFGSKHVYKNFFNQNQHVELFKLANIEAKFGLDREKLITLALLTGSDYTEGIEGIGAVTGMEVLSEFPGKGVQVLVNFRRWWNAQNQGVSAVRMSKIREKLAKVYLPEGFPNEAVFNAYTAPTVDESREKFCWSVPNVDALREFTAEKLGWGRSKTDEILVPVMKRMSVNSTQTRIDTFFNNIRLVKEPKATSKRLQEAIAKSKGEILSQSSPIKENLMDKIRKEQDAKRKTKCAKTSETAKVSKTLLLNDLPVPTKVSIIKSKPSRGKTQSVKSKSKPKALQGNTAELNALMMDQSIDATPAIILTKEEQKLQNYKRLLQHKEEIAQKKNAKAEMNAKKQQAALLLKAQIKTKKK